MFSKLTTHSNYELPENHVNFIFIILGDLFNFKDREIFTKHGIQGSPVMICTNLAWR